MKADDLRKIEQRVMKNQKVHLPLPMRFTECRTWFERDRAHVALLIRDPFNRDDLYDYTLVEWWDEAVAEAVEDGFLKGRNWHQEAYDYYIQYQLVPKDKVPRDFCAIKLSYVDDRWFVWDDTGPPAPDRHAPSEREGLEDTSGGIQKGDWIVNTMNRMEQGIVTMSGEVLSVPCWMVEVPGSGNKLVIAKESAAILWTKEELEYAEYAV